MGEFFSKNGMAVVKLYINQIAMSVFGLMVVVGFAGGSDSDLVIILASVFAVGLYLVIIYSMMWDEGARAASKTLRAEDAGIKKIKTPVLIVLFGSIFNILCYIIYAVIRTIIVSGNITEGDITLFGNTLWTVIKMTNAIYTGFEILLFPNPKLGMTLEQMKTTPPVIMLTPPYYFFLTLIPLFVVGIFAYYLGASEISIMRKLGFKQKHKSTTRINYNKDKK